MSSLSAREETGVSFSFIGVPAFLKMGFSVIVFPVSFLFKHEKLPCLKGAFVYKVRQSWYTVPARGTARSALKGGDRYDNFGSDCTFKLLATVIFGILMYIKK